MPTCPAGHLSPDHDRCDLCGLPMPAPPTGRPGHGQPDPAPDEHCPDCGAERAGRFCEACGHDFAAAARTEASPLSLPAGLRARAAEHAGAAGPAGPAAPRPDGADAARARPTWWAIVSADPAYYQAMADLGLLDPAAIAFPAHAPLRRVPLNRRRVRIGRRSLSLGIHPEIDLAGPPEDPAVSHAHATLLALPDGDWALVDEGSTNGTTLNGTARPIARDTEVPLHEADRIYVGAWTAITLHRQTG
ncbi:FHA domain-containing protein [Streptomonospora sp. PA3]|uniref:FHA domain-containing protein n=1 Tax=Streptomonospora sp. PA3 TaxID=2607326 RepID=UPI0012DBF23E|nr:FHA domain-containing protein [Streptomonospora sp. PA3]MUL41674.1 FHA domain-containing protein [Streptomonospora sp. PA3]